MRLLPMGERALLAEVADLGRVVALHAALAADPPAGIDDLVPAARTVLVVFDPVRIPASAVAAWIRGAASARAEVERPGTVVSIPLRYDGPDLDDTARLLGIPVADLVTRHAAAEWTVAFTGFAPGFAYLVSRDWPWDVPRLARPRTRVPAGSVGVAGEFSGAYPRDTPGGWRLLATTGARLFDPDAADPVLLPPRSRVRFVAERARAVASAAAGATGGDTAPLAAAGPRAAGGGSAPVAAASPAAQEADAAPTADAGARAAGGGSAPGATAIAAASGGGSASGGTDAADEPSRGRFSSVPLATDSPTLTVTAPGAAATIQDLGRPGRAALGVARSGALDRAALRIANRLVGNVEDAAGVEILLGGFTARAERDTWIAVTGALSDVRIDGRAVDAYAPLPLPAGSEVSIGVARAGLRCYLAVRGGLAVPVTLGSRSSDVLAGLGQAPVVIGDVLATGSALFPGPSVDHFPWSVPPGLVEVTVARGPRTDWFSRAALETLFEAPWTVSSDADRIGIRLDGPMLTRVRRDELPSEGMRPGAIQVPPHGRPVVLLADGPVTGGYPVIAVVTDAGLDALAQARPGDRVRIRRG
ncbi:5-oxoprolinase/urea amidolyase family protein [Microbacterium sp. VKM Ac-2923]|uniref:5-oxoprolinase subunit B/C family protein n=1 Tax=Microbacterium sp. VKM Ac-2923 TaxID=2929476 RepID=UPI001FB26EF6|nr:5-oxoprolinase/urea amidolyase family protein [Microbacterium sp. VKM Ac-2923]MCJ1706314.1 urea amidolyase family protein [Microbacterium sp. VKM Ac-2923]